MYFPDMGTSTQIAEGPHVRAIGWLDGEHPFPTGRVEATVLDRIRAFAGAWSESVKAMAWGVFAGPHTCELCGAFRASGNFAVPHDSILFVCPEMIAHYVAEHAYLPPPEFVAAIIAGELPGTDGYARAVARFRAGEGR